MTGFADAVEAFTRKAEMKVTRTFQTAARKLAREMIRTRDDGGALPKVTGNLMRSQGAALNAPIYESDGPFAGSDVGAIIAQATLRDAIVIGMQAKYARRRNFGFIGTRADGTTWEEKGAHYMERAVNMWPSLVEEAAREVGDG